jgi:hypothetical protein
MQPQLLAESSKHTVISAKKSLLFAWNEFLKDPWAYILYTLAGMAINLLVNLIPGVGKFLLLFVGLPLQLGVAIYFFNKKQNPDAPYKDFFLGFSKIKELCVFLITFLLGFLIALIPLFLMIVFAEMGAESVSGTEESSLGLPSIIVIGLYTPVIFFLSVSMAFAPYFIYFNNETAWDSMKLSYYFTKNRWFAFFVFYFIIILITMLGALPIVGILVTAPVASLAVFHQFYTTTKLREDEEEI